MASREHEAQPTTERQELVNNVVQQVISENHDGRGLEPYTNFIATRAAELMISAVLEQGLPTEESSSRPGVTIVKMPGVATGKTLDEIVSEGLSPETKTRLAAQSKARFDAIREAERPARDNEQHLF